MATLQLQDILFSQGFGTRRVCAGLIQQGFVTIDHEIQAQPATEFIADGLHFTVQGIEWRGDYGFGSNWHLRANLAWQKGQLDNFASTTSATSFREPLSRIMPVTANLRLEWNSEDQRWWLSSGLTLTGDADRLSEGDRNDTERIPPGGTPAYSLLSLHAGHVLTRHVSLVAGLENVLDSAYRTHGSGSNEAGIGGTVGLTIEF